MGAKTRTRWITGETPASSSKENEQTIDYITPGLLVCNSVGGVDSGAAEGAPHAIPLIFNLGWYPYNEAKSVFNRLRIWSTAVVSGGSGTQHIQYTINSGSTWTSAVTGAGVAPMAVTTPFGGSGSANDLDVDLNTLTPGFSWIGFRFASLGGAAINWVGWFVMAWLYRSNAYDTFADVDPY